MAASPNSHWNSRFYLTNYLSLEMLWTKSNACFCLYSVRPTELRCKRAFKYFIAFNSKLSFNFFTNTLEINYGRGAVAVAAAFLPLGHGFPYIRFLFFTVYFVFMYYLNSSPAIRIKTLSYTKTQAVFNKYICDRKIHSILVQLRQACFHFIISAHATIPGQSAAPPWLTPPSHS